MEIIHLFSMNCVFSITYELENLLLQELTLFIMASIRLGI